jgi:hypothetical protein
MWHYWNMQRVLTVTTFMEAIMWLVSELHYENLQRCLTVTTITSELWVWVWCGMTAICVVLSRSDDRSLCACYVEGDRSSYGWQWHMPSNTHVRACYGFELTPTSVETNSGFRTNHLII